MITAEHVVSQVDGLELRDIEHCVAEGWVRPVYRSEDPDREAVATFEEIDIARLRLILDLRRDMGVNDEAVPLVLSLLDQVHDLRAALGRAAAAIKQQAVEGGPGAARPGPVKKRRPNPPSRAPS